MGFFNKILKGLGFEDEEEEIPKKQKVKEKKVKKENVTASYDLGKLAEFEENLQTKVEEPQENNNQPSLDFELVKVKSQIDVQSVVQKIKQGQKVLINIEQLSQADITRSLDFVSGAVYALGLNLKKVDEKLYLISG